MRKNEGIIQFYKKIKNEKCLREIERKKNENEKSLKCSNNNVKIGEMRGIKKIIQFYSLGQYLSNCDWLVAITRNEREFVLEKGG